MRVLTTTEADRHAIRAWSADGPGLVVAVLCAAWCDTCGEFRASCERLAAACSDAMFVWLDIEDDSELCGDVDVENFPTLAIFRGDRLLHFGVTLPQEANVARLIARCAEKDAPEAVAPAAVSRLAAQLRRFHG